MPDGLFSAHKVKLEYRALRPDMPLLMAARGEQALALCGKIADGLMISNMCPPDFTRHAVEIIAQVRARGGTAAARLRSCNMCHARRGPTATKPISLAKETHRRDAAGLLVAGPAGAGGKVGVAAGGGVVASRISPPRSDGCARASRRRMRSMTASSRPLPSPAPRRTASPRRGATARPARASSRSPSSVRSRSRTWNISPARSAMGANPTGTSSPGHR